MDDGYNSQGAGQMPPPWDERAAQPGTWQQAQDVPYREVPGVEGVYEPAYRPSLTPEPIDAESLWEGLSAIRISIPLPWLVIGVAALLWHRRGRTEQ
jgi:hypothetical protein